MTSTIGWLLLGSMVVAMAVVATRGHALGVWAPLLPMAFVVVYMARAWWSARQPAPASAWQRPPDETRDIVSMTVKIFAGVGGAFVLFLVGNHFFDKWHPAVVEHRAELVDAAAKAGSCSPDHLTILAEKPKQARVEGCGQTRFFLWGQRNKGDKVHWREIDPNCTVDYLGFQLSCY